MAKHKTAMQLVDEAERVVETLSPAEVMALDPAATLLVDLRDIRERAREGFVPKSLHAPRGLLEFWIDPESPYHNTAFAEEKHFVFYCAMGWRSALAAKTAQEMGLARVSHVGGGYDAWREAGGPTAQSADGREPR